MKRKILIVGESEEFLRIIQLVLTAQGYEVLTAMDRDSAVSVVEYFTPDLVILDIVLADGNGWEVCWRIRGHMDLKVCGIPILLSSNLHPGKLIERGSRIGIDDYLGKPFQIKELTKKVRLLMSC